MDPIVINLLHKFLMNSAPVAAKPANTLYDRLKRLNDLLGVETATDLTAEEMLAAIEDRLMNAPLPGTGPAPVAAPATVPAEAQSDAGDAPKKKAPAVAPKRRSVVLDPEAVAESVPAAEPIAEVAETPTRAAPPPVKPKSGARGAADKKFHLFEAQVLATI